MNSNNHIPIMSPDKTETYKFTYKDLRHNNFYIILISFLTALTLITICSELSFLYCFSDNTDVHCFFTVGNSMLHGYIPYRDIYEQKGPILYMFFALGALISDTSFTGIFIFEVLCATVFLFIAYKTIQLFKDVSIVWIIILGAAVYSATGLWGGGEGEEFALPLLIYALYITAKTIKTGNPIPYKSAFFIGLTSACIFWFKYTIIGFYFGLALTVIVIRAKKDGKKLFYDLLFLTGGILIVSIPIIIYFGANNAINDMFTAYFYNNMFLYTKGSLLENLINGLCSALISNTLCIIMLILAVAYYVKRRKEKNEKEILLLILSVSFIFFFITYFGGRYYYYYSLPFCTLAPFGVVAISDSKYGHSIKTKIENSSLPECLNPIFTCVVCIACVLYSFFFSYCAYYRTFEKEDLPQFQFAAIINQEDNPTILNYGFMDSGFYTAAEILPTCKYFCMLNVPVQEQYEMQNEFVMDGKIDFIVTLNVELDIPTYEEVAESYYKPKENTYRLYKSVKSNISIDWS